MGFVRPVTEFPSTTVRWILVRICGMVHAGNVDGQIRVPLGHTGAFADAKCVKNYQNYK